MSRAVGAQDSTRNGPQGRRGRATRVNRSCLWILATLLLSAGCQAAPFPRAYRRARGHLRPRCNARAVAAAPQPTAAPATTASAPLTVVRVGTLNATTDAPFYLAQERGYLREEGSTSKRPPSTPASRWVAPLGADQLDAGGGAVGPGLYNAILRGINMRIVADRAQAVAGTRFHCLMARKSLLDTGALRTMADLRGGVFAEPVPANILTYALERGLNQDGVRLDEVHLVTVPWPEMANAFANGVIDVAFPIEPFVTLSPIVAWRSAGGRRLISPGHRDRPLALWPDLCRAAHRERPPLHGRLPARGARLLSCLLRGWSGPRRDRRADDPHHADQGSGATRAHCADVVRPKWGVNMASLRDTQRWYVERGDQAMEVDLQQAVDASFVTFALERLAGTRS